MGFFDSISKVVKNAKKFEGVFDDVKKAKDLGDVFDSVKDAVNKSSDKKEEKNSVDSKKDAVNKDAIKLANSKHWVETTEYCDDDKEYQVKFMIDDTFKEADSHAAELVMLNTYSPNSEYGEEGKRPYVGILMDDFVYESVEEFKNSKTVKGAIELSPLNGKFFFKAKKEYYGDMMYFYGLDRCDGMWENNGLCLVYQKSYVGTPDEEQLIKMFDELAESYVEIKK